MRKVYLRLNSSLLAPITSKNLTHQTVIALDETPLKFEIKEDGKGGEM